MKIFIPLSDEQLEQLAGHEIPVPYQPGCITLAQLVPVAPPRKISPDPAPARRLALPQVAAPSRR